MRSRQTSSAFVLALCGSVLLVAGNARAAGDARYERSETRYEVPDVTLLNQDRVEVRLQDILSQNKVVMVDFIFTTCTTICPVLSLGFKNLQSQLGKKTQRVQLVSISIDPEHDTPEKMKEYLARFGAKPGWDYLTGSRSDIDTVLKAFAAFVPDKMSHHPLKFLRGPGDEQWIRIEGFPTGKVLLEELQALEGR